MTKVICDVEQNVVCFQCPECGSDTEYTDRENTEIHTIEMFGQTHEFEWFNGTDYQCLCGAKFQIECELTHQLKLGHPLVKVM